MAAFDYAGKVRALLIKAASAEKIGNDEEAASYNAMAAKIMRQYKIAEEEALAVDPTMAVPTHLEMDIKFTGWELAHHYPSIARLIAEHTGVRVHTGSINGGYRFTFVGYDTDLRYTEFLCTAAHLMFATRITPTWDENRSEADNIFFMRNAGIERREIADRAWGYGAGKLAKNRSKVQRVYLRECATRGEEARATGLGFDTRTYREAYAESFVTTLRRRLRVARDAADSVGALPTLHGRTQRVQDAYDTLVPPAPVTDAQPWVDPRKECTKKACQEGRACREHSYMIPRAWTTRDQAALERRTSSASARAGQASGRAAADGVQVQRGHTTAARLDPSGKAIEM
jgi:hypothetical protein